MIPPFDPATGNLPSGIHEATWDEIVERFGQTEHRRRLLRGLAEAIAALRFAGCRRAYIDGSFVTDKPNPADFDACWELEGVNLGRLDPILKAHELQREAQKLKFGGELFPVDSRVDGGTRMLDFFQYDTRSGTPKGVIGFGL